ncbi:hypothetical protein [Desulforhabdus sp. TSK]|uniref:hypothetical protein n=1 Tax=Desulforhabdus sp. TSK TaxID=2925014 RepID=UPI001FC7C06D|nr:hypothetical protein [Desulforhabdus sp. TSK]GKT10239.1 hypothetical protein DSTSK_35440 [Desulforhabdus sp. TSK]
MSRAFRAEGLPLCGGGRLRQFIVWESGEGRAVPFHQAKEALLDESGEVGIRSGKKIKVKTAFRFNPVYNIPGGYLYIETLSSAEKMPLFVSNDTAGNESNLCRDYIVPDLCYPEGHYG